MIRSAGGIDQAVASCTAESVWACSVADLFNETLENGVYKSPIVLHNYERVNLMDFPESVQGRISQIEAKLDAQT